jgi:hypothetical protein
LVTFIAGVTADGGVDLIVESLVVLELTVLVLVDSVTIVSASAVVDSILNSAPKTKKYFIM